MWVYYDCQCVRIYSEILTQAKVYTYTRIFLYSLTNVRLIVKDFVVKSGHYISITYIIKIYTSV